MRKKKQIRNAINNLNRKVLESENGSAGIAHEQLQEAMNRPIYEEINFATDSITNFYDSPSEREAGNIREGITHRLEGHAEQVLLCGNREYNSDQFKIRRGKTYFEDEEWRFSHRPIRNLLFSVGSFLFGHEIVNFSHSLIMKGFSYPFMLGWNGRSEHVVKDLLDGSLDSFYSDDYLLSVAQYCAYDLAIASLMTAGTLAAMRYKDIKKSLSFVGKKRSEGIVEMTDRLSSQLEKEINSYNSQNAG